MSSSSSNSNSDVGGGQIRRWELIGPVLCGAAGLCLVGALAVELDSTAAKTLMVAAAVLFVPGAVLTLAFVRRHLGPPR